MTVVTWLGAVLSIRLAEPTQQWLNAMYDAARDERYLLGQELLNYPLAS
jgi:hypothetical protein